MADQKKDGDTPEELRISGNLTLEDALHFNAVVCKKRKCKTCSRIYAASTIIAFLVFFICVKVSDTEITLGFIQSICATIIAFLLSLTFLLKKFQKSIYEPYFREDRTIDVKSDYVINNEGIKAYTEYGETYVKWSGVQEIIQDKDYIFVFTTPRKAHIFPARCFATREEFEHFYNALLKLWKPGT